MMSIEDILEKLKHEYDGYLRYIDELCKSLLSLDKEKFLENINILINKSDESKEIALEKILNSFTSSLDLRFYHLVVDNVEQYADIFQETFPIKYFALYIWKIGMKSQAENLINKYHLELEMTDYNDYFSRFNPTLSSKSINISAGPSLTLSPDDPKKFESMLLKIKLERSLDIKKVSSTIKV